MNIVEVKKLSITYKNIKGDVSALKDVSFSLRKSEILGIVGESGSGKSTLAFSILRLLPANAYIEGKILFEGRDIFSLHEKEMRKMRGKKINIVFQSPQDSFNPVLSIGYQFREFLKEKLPDKSSKDLEEIIFDSLKKVKIDEPKRILESFPHQLSGGQIQRIAIAFSISTNPLVVIADEPTSSLDVTIESQIAHLFLELKETLGISVIFVTHNLSLAKVVCDRIGVIFKGELVEIGNKDEIFFSPKSNYTQQLINSFKQLEDVT